MAINAVAERQAEEEVAELAGDLRGQTEGERFLGRKVGGVVSQPGKDTWKEPESTCVGQANVGRSPSKRNRGEGGHRLIAGAGENERANRCLASTNLQQEEEEPDAEEGREKWTAKEGERRALEEGRK